MAVFLEQPVVPGSPYLSSLGEVILARVEVTLTLEWLFRAMFNQQQPLPHIKFQPQCHVQSGHDPHNSNCSGLGLRNSEPHISFRHEVGSSESLRSGRFLRVVFLFEMIDWC